MMSDRSRDFGAVGSGGGHGQATLADTAADEPADMQDEAQGGDMPLGHIDGADAPDWTDTLPATLGRAWHLLTEGAARRNRFASRPVLATLSPDGWPEARTLLLRSADRSAGLLRFFTDAETHKMASLAAHPRAAVHVWDPEAEVQLRITAEVQVLTGGVTQAEWDALPQAGLVNYGKVPVPGTPIDAPLAYTETRDRAAFAVIEARVVALELLHLSATHRRARFVRADGWAGAWISP